MRAVERADRDLMGDDVAEALAFEPCMEMEGRRLDLEGRCAEVSEIEVDRMVRRRADRAGHAGKHGQDCAMDMPGDDELDARMAPDDRREVARIAHILAVHVPDAA